MKRTLPKSQYNRLLRTTFGTTGWALCIGAGTSLPVFPSWKDLVTSLISRVDNSNAGNIANSLLSCYSPDAVLHAVYELMSVGERQYSQILSETLYSFAKAQLATDEYRIFRDVLSQSGPERVPHTVWTEFVQLRERHFARTTAYQLARVISSTTDTEKQPSEILSFNAELFLYALVNSFCYEAFRTNHPSPSETPKRFLDFVNRSISAYKRDRIQYIFNHGVLPPPDSNATSNMTATDKLVFREGEYLNLANTAFSWQSTTFLDVCLKRPTVFVGVSLSDPNMRRWLTWIQTNRSKEIEMSNGRPRISTRHFWITKRPEHDYMIRRIEACVYHLGVRIIWIDQWDDVGLTLSTMLGTE